MTTKATTLRLMIVAVFASLCLPFMTAQAQGRYDPWPNRGQNRRNDDRRTDYNYVRDAVRRVKESSKDFQQQVDRTLDRSRYDDTRREDRINEVAKDFRKAADNLEDRFDNRDLSRSAGEARRLLDLANRIDRFASSNRMDSRVRNEWSRIEQDLRVIANAYNVRFSGGYGRNDDYRRDRRDDQRSSNRPWWRP